jgi:polyisoprenoid-binding protein YceI
LARSTPLLLAGLLWASVAAGQAVPAFPLRSADVTFRVHVHSAPDFTGRAPVDSASYSGDSLVAVRGLVVVRVGEMRTGNGLRDHHMRGAMAASEYPEIRFELLGVTPEERRGDTVAVSFAGRLTIHGRTRSIALPGTVVLGPRSVEVASSFPLDMREYGIAPPTRFLGIVRVQPLLEIEVRLVFAPAGPGPAP